jgi:hypothetical protein
MNYQVDFSKKVKQQTKRSNGGLGAIPRSRHSPLAPRPRSMPPSVDDDFSNDFHFGSPRAVVLSDSPGPSLRLKPKSKRGSLFPDQAPRRSQGGGQAFASRYDFGASLSNALSSAQKAMGDHSGLKVNTTSTANKGYFDRPAPAQKAHTTGAPIPGTRPDSLSSEKPDLQSAEYNELIQKFCFFGTPGKLSPPGTTPSHANTHMDGAMEYALNNSSGSNNSSATSSPPSPAMPLLVDGASDLVTRTPSPFLSRSTSPGPVTGSGPEDLLASQYQYGYNMPGGMFHERSHTPTACV